MLHGVLDPQPGQLAFALFDDGKLLGKKICIMQPRDASNLPLFVEESLAECGYDLQSVHYWSFGSGPGSFTFLRVVSALGAGWAAANTDFHFRCIPGALAMAKCLDLAEGESGGILYDGRNKEILFFGVKKENGKLFASGEDKIIPGANSAEFFAGKNIKLAAFAKDAAVLQGYLGEQADLLIAEADLSAFVEDDSPFDNDADKMNYIRPAVAGA